MHIVMVTTEYASITKEYNPADSVFGLSRELIRYGHKVEIILPKYANLHYAQMQTLAMKTPELLVPWDNDVVHCNVFTSTMAEQNCIFIDAKPPHNFFQQNNYSGHPDANMRFAFFSKAVLEFLNTFNIQPDVIHTHDWQTALIPILLHEYYRYNGLQQQRTCHTIHNFKEQGVIADKVLIAAGLNAIDQYHYEQRMQDSFNPSALNLTKGAINCADFITTVSPRYAWEVRFTEQGYGLGHILFQHRQKFGGIINGIDCEVWNPHTDSNLPYNYNIDNIEPKYSNKRALRDQLDLNDEFQPIIAYIGNFSSQNGVHLIRHAMFHTLEHGAQFILLGIGLEPGTNEEFLQLKRDMGHNPNCHLELNFNDNLAHLIYAGSDMIVIPSLAEPCGYSQMIALRYGTIPIVHGVGGLIDTVFDRDYSDKPSELRNGYVFHDPDYQGIESAMQRAIGLWHSFPGEFRQLMRNGMQQDVSWQQPTQDYINIYKHIQSSI